MKVLCTCLPGYGHFFPMVPLARAVVEAGHDIAFATAADFCTRVEKNGFTSFPAGLSLAEQLEQAARRYPDQHGLPPGKERFLNFVPRMLAGVAAPPRASDLMGIVEEWRPDVIVHDETEFGAAIAATKADIPYADHSVGILRPLEMARLAGETVAPVAERWGVDVGRFGGMFHFLYLDVCPPSLQSADISRIAVAHQMQNAHIEVAAGDRLPAWIASLPSVPTVYVSLGTIFNQNLGVFSAILDGLGGEDLNVIVTIGAGNDPAALGPQPDNVHVEPFIPQSLLLPHCDVVVNQGGTAILPILAHGLPVLVLPQGANQFHNAEAVVGAGAGRRLLPAEVNAVTIRSDVRHLLDDPGYRARAQGIAAEMAAMPGPDRAVRLLEQLAEQRQPLPTPAVTHGGRPTA